MKRPTIVIITVIVAIAVAMAALWASLNKPAIAKIPPQATANPTPKPPDWTTLAGRQFSMQYLNDYMAKQADLHQGLDQYFFIENGLITKHLAVAVATMNGHGLDEEPAYQMRALAPETYKLDTRVLNGVKIPIMERLDHTEQVAFMVHGNLLGTIALTTGNPADPPINELNHMAASWVWK